MKVVTTTVQTIITLTLFALGAVFVASVLPIGGVQSKIVQSGSMEPAIPVGALVVIVPATTYEAGDVITFGKRGAIPTTHRIAAVEGSGAKATFITKGDANEEADTAPVPFSQVQGRVLVSLPYVGFVLDFARQPLGFALLIALPAVMIMLEEVWSLFQQVRALRRRRPEALPRAARVAYKRVRVSDDVFMRVALRMPVQKARNAAAPAVGLVMAALLVVGAGQVGHTVSYFSDTELSTNNTLAAGEWPTMMLMMVPEPLQLAAPEAEEQKAQEPEVLGADTQNDPAEQVADVEPEQVTPLEVQSEEPEQNAEPQEAPQEETVEAQDPPVEEAPEEPVQAQEPEATQQEAPPAQD